MILFILQFIRSVSLLLNIFHNENYFHFQIIESKIEGGCQQYKVHYAGWNIRYDEWVKKDRIVAVVDESASGSKSKVKQRMLGPPGGKAKVSHYC